MTASQAAHILIVDGSEDSRQELRDAMYPTPVEIQEAADAAAALRAAEQTDLDLVLAEVRLPDVSGFSLCRQLRENAPSRELPVILVSHWSSEMDRVLAFECGADDFLGRPFFDRELSSRVTAVLRRKQEQSRAPSGDEPPPVMAPTPGYREIRVGGQILDLTPKEASILLQLAASDGAVRSRRQLIMTIWDEETAPSDRCIDSHVKSLRRKLGPAGDSVETVRGIGYRFSAHPELDLS